MGVLECCKGDSIDPILQQSNVPSLDTVTRACDNFDLLLRSAEE
jgi:hypothetical protein